MQRWMYRLWSVALAAAAVGSVAAVSAHAAAPNSPPRATSSAEEAATEPDREIKGVYINTPADTILNDLAAEYDLVILKPAELNARISVRIGEDADAQDAISAVKESLLARGYSLQPGDAIGRVWQVVPATPGEQQALATARRAGEDLEDLGTRTMKFRFEDAPVEAILNDITLKLGIEIARTEPVPGRISVYVPNPVDAEEALRLLNAILAPSGFTSIEIARYNTDGTPRLAVRVWPIDEAKKGNVPVD